jgi:hypothetical protein
LGLGENVPQPPFAWRDADAEFLAVSFTYNTSAFFRIFSELQKAGQIPANSVGELVDRACLLLAQLYRAKGHFLIRNINNNFNMLLISRVVEFLVGKKVYNSEMQELDLTRQSLAASLALAGDHLHLPLKKLMGIAVAKGVSFIESRIVSERLGKLAVQQVQDVTWRYGDGNLVIDDRDDLIKMISDAGPRKNGFTLAVILDDATETVDDLLWLMAAMDNYPFLKVHLLVNKAQVSINFSVQMFDIILRTPCFKGLANHLNGQLRVLPIYCPLVSFQTEYLPQRAKRAISQADAVYIKGANFFETCQIPEKETFYAFVVFGPISRLYTGLQNFDAVFAHLPAGTAGYVHNQQSEKIVTLTQIVQERHRRESGKHRSAK